MFTREKEIVCVDVCVCVWEREEREESEWEREEREESEWEREWKGQNENPRLNCSNTITPFILMTFDYLTHLSIILSLSPPTLFLSLNTPSLSLSDVSSNILMALET